MSTIRMHSFNLPSEKIRVYYSIYYALVKRCGYKYFIRTCQLRDLPPEAS